MVSLVDGSYSVGGTSTRPSANRTARIWPSRRPVRKRPMTGPTERVYPPGYSSTRSAVKVSDISERASRNQFAQVVVGDTEHRDVGNLRVLVDATLDLGRVDVDPARDDHVALTVAEEQI